MVETSTLVPRMTGLPWQTDGLISRRLFTARQYRFLAGHQGPVLPSSILPLCPQCIQPFWKIGMSCSRTAPMRPHPVPPQQAVLILRQRHEKDPFLRPPRLGGDGEHLSG